MSYLGRTQNKSSDIRRFDVTSSTSATHTLTWTPPNELSLIVTINGVKQHEDAYSVSGTTLTLTSALVAEDKLEVIGINDLGTTITPAQNSVTNEHITNSAAIDATKVADGTVTSTEFQYINTLSSNAQTQIDAKGATAGSSSIVTVGTVTAGTWEATDVAILHGGTGASTDSAARTNLGVAIGSDVQAYDADTAKLDVDQSWSGSQRGTPSTVTNGTLDLDTANNFLYTPAAADVLEFSNETTGQSGFIKLINPSAYTISLGSEVKAVSTFATDVSVAGTYLVSYFSDGTNVYVSSSAALV
ncbi:MAG: hypothetical protein QF535_05165 [Anaerolineales bacterium]|nr:hypothetical protein [Anaerolineales bacterium]